MAEILSRLNALRPIVETIRTASGAAGVSVGVIHKGQLILTDNFGFRDVKAKLPPNEDTIYYLSSLSKSFTAAAVAHLVDQTPQLDWNTPVSEALPDLSSDDDEIRRDATVADFLSHRTGLTNKNHLWNHEYGHFTMRQGEDVRVVRYLEKIAEFRSRWIYNNWGYAVAVKLIESFANTSFGDFLRERILDPLGMTRTLTKPPEHDDNVAKPYFTLTNGDDYEIEGPDGENGQILVGAIGIRSSVRDLSKYYIAFLQAEQASQSKPLLESCRPFVDAARMVEPHVDLPTDVPADEAYGLGWATVRLPCTLGIIGINNDRPVVGRGLRNKTKCYYHNGSAVAYLSSVHLLPETGSGVIVLTNSMAHNDAADWIGQVYVETILDIPDKNDYVKLAKDSASATLTEWAAMYQELAQKRISHTTPGHLDQYAGEYYNRIGNFPLTILLKGDKLLLQFPSEGNIAYELTHYHHNTFSWLLSYDHTAKLGRFPIPRASYYLIHFNSHGDDNTQIDSLSWHHDDCVPQGELLFKRDGPCAHKIEADPAKHPPMSLRRNDADVERIASALDGRVEVVSQASSEGHAERKLAVIYTENIEDEPDVIPVDGAGRSDDSKL